MQHPDPSPSSSNRLRIAIAAVLLLYAITACLGWPQRGTAMIRAAAQPSHAAQAAGLAPEREPPSPPPYWMAIPFGLLLGAIAVFPLLPQTEHWWESNLNRFYVAAILAGLTLSYYLFLHPHPISLHWPVHQVILPAQAGPNYGHVLAVLANAILNEYIPFIMLLLSLYVISGGIRIEGDLRAHPLTNTIFIGIGGVLASFIGTTGAAMLIIRPLLETNAERKHVQHTVIFFIFVVCNCGGCLLPLGDPPLFLGYLRGVPFLWTLALWPNWLFVNGLLLLAYYLWDHYGCYPHETLRDRALDEIRVRGLKLSGIWPNAFLLLGVILSVALLDPQMTFPGTAWHPWVYLREIAQLALIAVSLLLGSELVRRKNAFNYHAIVEVAVLFFGIFICMQPPLDILHAKGANLANLGLQTPSSFFWMTGSLSSVLDNAPTYVVFFETAKAIPLSAGAKTVAGVQEELLIAVSLGAVFMGAMTYIGNGPNFMVKAIAEKSGVHMPSFFGYMGYSFLVMLPILILHMVVFF